MNSTNWLTALADPTRRDMVARLALTDATVNELAAPYDVSIQAVSKHLKVQQMNETEITVDPKVPMVTITREFDAPPANMKEGYERLDALLAR